MEKKRLWITIIVAVVLVGAVCWFISDRNKKEEAAHHLTLSGNVDVREVTLSFRSGDRIESLLVDEGDHVKKGQPLGRLETRDLAIQLAQTKAQVLAQQSAVDKLHNGTRPEEIEQAAERRHQCLPRAYWSASRRSMTMCAE